MPIINGTPDGDHISSGPTDDTLNGLGSDDYLIGGAGSDILNGGEGNDYLEAFNGSGGGSDPGVDTLDGGAGDDELITGNVLVVGSSAIGGAGRRRSMLLRAQATTKAWAQKAPSARPFPDVGLGPTLTAWIGEVDAVVRENSVDLVGDGFDEVPQGLGCDARWNAHLQFGVSELRGLIDRHEKIELAFPRCGLRRCR